MKKTVDPLFAAYAASAPPLDLLCYIEYANRHRADFGPSTISIVEHMIALYNALTGLKPGTTASQKKRVWAIIPAFRASLSNAWLHRSADERDADDFYFSIAQALTRAYLDVPALTDSERAIVDDVDNADAA